jgi:DNA-binding MarR family transcriptional regulator
MMTDMLQEIQSEGLQPETLDDGHQTLVNAFVALRRAADAAYSCIEDELGKFNLTQPLYGILLNLSVRGPLPLSELSELIFRSNSTITALIDRLEVDGLAFRSPSEKDRRVIMANITEKGCETLAQIRPIHREFIACVMSALSEDEAMKLTELLDRIVGRK